MVTTHGFDGDVGYSIMTDKDYKDFMEISLRKRDLDMYYLLDEYTLKCTKQLIWLRNMGLVETYHII